MELEESDPVNAFTCKILDEEVHDDEEVVAGDRFAANALPPIVEYFDEKGNNVTPLPLHAPDEADQEMVRAHLYLEWESNCKVHTASTRSLEGIPFAVAATHPGGRTQS